MNLISFPGYTCGAILCDILNKESSQVGPNNNILSGKHNILKIELENGYNGKEFSKHEFATRIDAASQYKKLSNAWIGTHCWVGDIDVSKFNNIIVITTETKNSKIYRFARVFYTMISGRFPYTKAKKPKDIKMYNQSYEKVNKPNFINIEFEDFVEWKNDINEILINFVGVDFQKHIDSRRKLWVEINDFLYDDTKMNYIHKEWNKINQ